MPARINSPFTRFAKKTSTYTGRPATFIIAVLVIVVWACTGPLFGYGDTWQLVINTGTTIITFLMVFLIQNTQTCLPAGRTAIRKRCRSSSMS